MKYEETTFSFDSDTMTVRVSNPTQNAIHFLNGYLAHMDESDSRGPRWVAVCCYDGNGKEVWTLKR